MITRKPSPATSRVMTIIEPGADWRLIGLREIWQFRELLRVLTTRDVKVRYKQTVLGIGWAIFQPFVAMVVFTVVLNGAAGVKSEPGLPYPVFTYSGLIIWLYFSDAISRASTSLVTNKTLVSKVYFPRLIAPLSGVAAPVLDFGIAFTILIALMQWYGVAITWTMVLAIPLLFGAMLCAAAFGIWLAALNVEYRDIGYAVPLAVQLGLFLTPVVYSPANVHGPLRIVYALNPMAGIVMAFRWAVLHHGTVDWGLFATSTVVLVAVLVTGVFFFRRVERTFADAI